VDLADRILSAVSPHPHVRSIQLVGSRASGTAKPESDWDFRVEVDDFVSVATGLPDLLAPLEPLAQQWDRLSDEQCWMMILRGPTKVDLIFPEEPHDHEAPWEPRADNLEALDAHFWDWMLWLYGKEASGKRELVAAELEKVRDHLLLPLGVERVPSWIGEAISNYQIARDRTEKELGCSVSRRLEQEVAPALFRSREF
jgi:Nucleotidyltransferase domain